MSRLRGPSALVSSNGPKAIGTKNGRSFPVSRKRDVSKETRIAASLTEFQSSAKLFIDLAKPFFQVLMVRHEAIQQCHVPTKSEKRGLEELWLLLPVCQRAG